MAHKPAVILLLGPRPRLGLVEEVLDKTLSQAGCWFDLLVCNNGCPELQPLIRGLCPALWLYYQENIGVAQAINQLLLRWPQAPWYAHIAPDIEYPPTWLARWVSAAEQIPETGMVGFHCTTEELGMPTRINEVEILQLKGAVFGGGLWPGWILGKLGFFAELSMYGMEDSEFGMRLAAAGLLRYYLPGEARHWGNDVLSQDEYRKFKWEQLSIAEKAYGIRLAEIARGNLYVPPPPLLVATEEYNYG